MILIIAETYSMAERWAYDHGVRKHTDFRFVRDAYDLRGRRGTKYVKIGRYYNRSQWPDIEEAIKYCGLVWTDPDLYRHEETR